MPDSDRTSVRLDTISDQPEVIERREHLRTVKRAATRSTRRSVGAAALMTLATLLLAVVTRSADVLQVLALPASVLAGYLIFGRRAARAAIREATERADPAVHEMTLPWVTYTRGLEPDSLDLALEGDAAEDDAAYDLEMALEAFAAMIRTIDPDDREATRPLDPLGYLGMQRGMDAYVGMLYLWRTYPLTWQALREWYAQKGIKRILPEGLYLTPTMRSRQYDLDTQAAGRVMCDLLLSDPLLERAVATIIAWMDAADDIPDAAVDDRPAPGRPNPR